MNCTYQDCSGVAKHSEVAKDGHVWARLCDAHHQELSEAIAGMKAPRLARTWVRCQGGSKAAAERMSASVGPTMQRLMAALSDARKKRDGEGK